MLKKSPIPSVLLSLLAFSSTAHAQADRALVSAVTAADLDISQILGRASGQDGDCGDALDPKPVIEQVKAGTSDSCVPIDQAIPFTATDIHFDFANIIAGALPGQDSVGQVVLGGTPTKGPYQRFGVDGAITLNITQDSVAANASGYVQISPVTRQDILNQVQMGGLPGKVDSVCVSGIAINVGHYNNTIYGGSVYLYLNGSSHGYALYF
jgi:hypothetical protein